MRRAWIAMLLMVLAASCGGADPAADAAPDAAAGAAECGPRPGGCDDVGDLTGCGVTLCGAWERCECSYDEPTDTWRWRVDYVDCLCAEDAGAPDA